MSYKPTQQVKDDDKNKRDYHIAGDGRPLPNIDAKKQVGDYIVKHDMSKVYKVTEVITDNSKPCYKRVEGVEAERVLLYARMLKKLCEEHAREKELEAQLGVVGNPGMTGDANARTRVELLKKIAAHNARNARNAGRN